jgi:hypothetical protein
LLGADDAGCDLEGDAELGWLSADGELVDAAGLFGACAHAAVPSISPTAVVASKRLDIMNSLSSDDDPR